MKSIRSLSVFFITILLVSVTIVTMVHVASASPGTSIFCVPSTYNAIGKPVNHQFIVWVNVTEAPPTFGWEIRVTWDPNLLFLFSPGGILEGEFLKRGVTGRTTMYTYPSTVAQANVKGEIKIGCSLKDPDDVWASGNGRLVRLGFQVKASGGIPVTGSTLINLFDTVLLDHIEAGSPAPTPYPNSDCFVYNVSPSHDISGRARYIKLINASVHVGEVARINVTVLNEGTVTEPSVTLNVKANNTLIGTTSLSLNGTGNFENRSRTYTVNWNTAGFALGRYNITASVPAVTGEVDTADNTFMGELQVEVLPVGDINRDGVVDVNDLILLNAGYGTTSMGSPWDPNNDLNKDNIVNVRDLFLLGKDYGKRI